MVQNVERLKNLLTKANRLMNLEVDTVDNECEISEAAEPVVRFNFFRNFSRAGLDDNLHGKKYCEIVTNQEIAIIMQGEQAHSYFLNVCEL